MIFSRAHGNSNVLTLVERHTRYMLLLANPDRKATKVRTLTFDRGFEFPQYGKMPAPSSYCDPQKPWRKGDVENTNGRIHRLFLVVRHTALTPDRLPMLTSVCSQFIVYCQYVIVW